MTTLTSPQPLTQDQQPAQIQAQVHDHIPHGVITQILDEGLVPVVIVRDGGHDRLRTTQETAEHLGVSADTIRRLTRGGHIPVVYVGRLPRYSISDVLAALAGIQGVDR